MRKRCLQHCGGSRGGMVQAAPPSNFNTLEEYIIINYPPQTTQQLQSRQLQDNVESCSVIQLSPKKCFPFALALADLARTLETLMAGLV